MDNRGFERYSRQMLFAPIGEKGQRALAESRVLIVGLGALGTVLASHMVRSGTGAVRLVDRDYVETGNLQRQMLFDEEDAAAALPKAVAAERKLRRINGEVELEAVVSDVTALNVRQLIEDADIVLDGTDNFATRLLLNDASHERGVPFVYGGAVGDRGMTAMFVPGVTGCLRCLFGDARGDGQTCDTVGVISPIVDIVASFQAVEALKHLTGAKEARRGSLLTFELWNHRWLEAALPGPRTDCQVCGRGEYPALRAAAAPSALTLCGRDTVQISGASPIDLDRWEKRLANICRVSRNPFLLRAKRPEGGRIVLFQDGRALVQGTTDPVRARTLYDRYVGI